MEDHAQKPRRLTIKNVLRGYRGVKGKFFLALSATVLGVIVVVFWVLNYFLRGQVLQTLDAEVQRAARLFLVMQQHDREQLLEKGQIWASVPQLKAALDDHDVLNMQLVLKQLYQGELAAHKEPFALFSQAERPLPRFANPGAEANAVSDICLIYNRDGRLLMTTTRTAETEEFFSETRGRFALPDSLLSLAWTGKERFAAWNDRHGAWWGVIVPIWAGGSPFGPWVIGALILGVRLDDMFAQHTKALVGAEVAFVLAEKVAAASMNGNREKLSEGIEALVKNSNLTATPQLVAMARENFLTVSLPLFENDSPDQVILFRSIDRSIRPLLAPVQRTLFIVGLGAFLAALGISLIISRNITQPIARLVDAAHAAGAGRLDQPIQISSRDEIGYLARRFEAMRQSLKQQMEKLTELNASLVERNADLETALAQLRRAQEELIKTEKLAAAGKLTAQLSHEINNPIHNIRSSLETALKKMPEALAGRQFVQLAHDEILRIGKLVRQMLDFYRFGQVELQAVDLNTTLVEVLESSQQRFKEYGIKVERHLAPNLPAVRASRDQMKQVFLNLILNAIEAMPHGGKLEARSSSGNGLAEIEIGDTGSGIPPENLAKIFDTFFTTKRAVHGVGLGLSVCYNIVHQHGGTIEVQSEVGKGSRFTVKLPLAEKMEQNVP
jgi:signal transduction histidine kinase